MGPPECGEGVVTKTPPPPPIFWMLTYLIHLYPFCPLIYLQVRL
jgi:hypothetical protein